MGYPVPIAWKRPPSRMCPTKVSWCSPQFVHCFQWHFQPSSTSLHLPRGKLIIIFLVIIILRNFDIRTVITQQSYQTLLLHKHSLIPNWCFHLSLDLLLSIDNILLLKNYLNKLLFTFLTVFMPERGWLR